jgi:hypothetical protein
MRFPDADHWLHHRETRRVNQALIEFLAQALLPLELCVAMALPQIKRDGVRMPQSSRVSGT